MDAAAAFALLGEPVRLEIVLALHDQGPGTPPSFTALYELVSAEDTGRFNYHLNELLDRFVTRSDAGYSLTAAGRRVARTVEAGVYTDAPTVDPVTIEGACYACGESALAASYRDEVFRVECRGCGEPIVVVRVPPSLAQNRSPAAFVEAVSAWSESQVDQAVKGLCPACGGAVTPSISTEVHESIAFEAVAAFSCPVCGRTALTSVGTIAARDPRVEAFLEEREVSVWERPYWEVPQFVAGEGVTVESRDPWRVSVRFEAGGDVCVATVDGELCVVEVAVEESTS